MTDFRPLFTVSRDGDVIAGFMSVTDAENFAQTLSGVSEVRSRGDGYLYYRFEGGVMVLHGGEVVA